MLNDDESMNIALYTRDSTDEQAKEGFSLELQLERLRAFCVAKGWGISKEYIDPGFSGRNTRRPAYQQMFNDIDTWDGILVFKMDRIHRNRLNFIEMMEKLGKQNKDFTSMTENWDTTSATGRFTMGIMQDVAQLESEQIGERVTYAMIQKAKDFKAGFVGHRLAHGYKLVKKIKNGEEVKEIHVVPDELEIVKQIFKLYSEGNSIPKIQKMLKLKYGRVRYPLTNIWYVGYEQWGNHFKLIPITPAISLDLWNVVQTKRCNARGRSRKFRPFILEERVESFTLSDKEMDEFGLWNHRIKNKVGG